MYHGCPPNLGVPAVSTFVPEVFDQLFSQFFSDNYLYLQTADLRIAGREAVISKNINIKLKLQKFPYVAITHVEM